MGISKQRRYSRLRFCVSRISLIDKLFRTFFLVPKPRAWERKLCGEVLLRGVGQVFMRCCRATRRLSRNQIAPASVFPQFGNVDMCLQARLRRLRMRSRISSKVVSLEGSLRYSSIRRSSSSSSASWIAESPADICSRSWAVSARLSSAGKALASLFDFFESHAHGREITADCRPLKPRSPYPANSASGRNCSSTR